LHQNIEHLLIYKRSRNEINRKITKLKPQSGSVYNNQFLTSNHTKNYNKPNEEAVLISKAVLLTLNLDNKFLRCVSTV
jgi:hypothetical protein